MEGAGHLQTAAASGPRLLAARTSSLEMSVGMVVVARIAYHITGTANNMNAEN